MQFKTKRQVILSVVLVQVVAVAGRKIEEAKRFADKFNISKAYGSYEELAKDPQVGMIIN